MCRRADVSTCQCKMQVCMPYGGFVCECSNAGLLTIQPVIPIKKNKVSPSLRRQEACHSDEGGVGRGRGEARIKPTNRLANEMRMCTPYGGWLCASENAD